MFADIAKVYLKAGNGGNGAVSFHREKYIASGGPDGGDGGRGGNIVFVADNNLSTLADFRYKRKYVAQNGDNGGTSRCSGKSAPDLIIKVPRGTLVKEAETGRIIADIFDDEPVVIAKGGNGGWGNQHFASPTRQVPRFAKKGNPGQEIEAILELKLLADVGLLGFPNVGKSTFISAVSEAKPKIANYHFTTLTPVLGVVRIEEGTSFVMADIPGLIEGAGKGVGLGHEFLRHVERCRLLIHVIDASGCEGRDPIADFEKINSELLEYNEELSAKPQIVAANKCDLATDEQLEQLSEYFKKKEIPFFKIMAPIGEGCGELIKFTAQELSKLPVMKRYEAEPKPLEDVVTKRKDRSFEIIVNQDVFIIEAPWLMDILNDIDPDDYDSLQYFQRVLIQTGIINALKQKGIQEGDTVSVYDIEFEYVP